MGAQMRLLNGSVEELRQRAESGESFHIEAGTRPIEELVLLAAAASSHGGRVTFHGLGSRPLSELLKLARAGGWWSGRLES